MKSIKQISGHIREELSDAEEYVREAMVTADAGQTGRWVGWAGSGTQAAPAG